MAGDEFEGNEAEPGAGGAAGVEDPEIGGEPFLDEASDPADGVAGGEGQASTQLLLGRRIRA
jgi:hypothetical protein